MDTANVGIFRTSTKTLRRLTSVATAAALGTFLAAGSVIAADMPDRGATPAPTMAASPWALSFGFALVSDYNFRGISQTARKPGVQASAEVTYTINPNFQVYANVFAASLKLPSQASMELDGSFGIRPSFGNLGFDFGATYYGYPGELPGVRSEFWEYYGKVSYKFLDRVTVGANIFHAPNWLNLSATGTYYSATLGIDLPHNFAISGEVGHYSLGRPTGAATSLPDYNYWNAGISYTYKAVTLDLRYHSTDLSRVNCQALVGQPGVTRSKWCGSTVIGSLKFDHSIENLFGSSAPVTAKY